MSMHPRNPGRVTLMGFLARLRSGDLVILPMIHQTQLETTLVTKDSVAVQSLESLEEAFGAYVSKSCMPECYELLGRRVYISCHEAIFYSKILYASAGLRVGSTMICCSSLLVFRVT